jgi:hypothetical protein
MPDKMKFISSAIDALAFYGGNYAIHSGVRVPSPKMRHVVIFALADILIRYGYLKNDTISEFVNYVSADNMKQDAYISTLYVLLSAAFDMLIEKDSVKTAVLENAIRGAVGFGANVALDMVIPAEYR